MKDMLLFFWQLPQNLLGLLVILITRARKTKDGYWVTGNGGFGVSLGYYIIFGDCGDRREILEKNIKHEQGHQKQSLYVGWLYLILIGLPSLLGNLWDRFFHFNWSYEKREKWYYNKLPWEYSADILGGVRR